MKNPLKKRFQILIHNQNKIHTTQKLKQWPKKKKKSENQQGSEAYWDQRKRIFQEIEIHSSVRLTEEQTLAGEM